MKKRKSENCQGNKKNRIIIPQQKFDSYEEVEKLIRYITRTREDDKRSDRECIAYGGHGVTISDSIEEAISQFHVVYSLYKPPRSGCNRHAFHEFYNIEDEVAEILSIQGMDELGYRLSEYYWNQGFQVIYGVHKASHYHIHFAVNAVSMKGNAKWSPDGRENRIREAAFHQITEKVAGEWREEKTGIEGMK